MSWVPDLNITIASDQIDERSPPLITRQSPLRLHWPLTTRPAPLLHALQQLLVLALHLRAAHSGIQAHDAVERLASLGIFVLLMMGIGRVVPGVEVSEGSGTRSRQFLRQVLPVLAGGRPLALTGLGLRLEEHTFFEERLDAARVLGQ